MLMLKMKSKASQHNMFLRILTTPVRALCKARDFYVRSLTNYADRMNHGNVMAAIPVTSQVSGLPRSFTVNSARSRDHHDQELVIRGELEAFIKHMKIIGAAPPRSSSVAMGRIDEDGPYFGEQADDNYFFSGKTQIKYPRSTSHAVTPTRLSAF